MELYDLFDMLTPVTRHQFKFQKEAPCRAGKNLGLKKLLGFGFFGFFKFSRFVRLLTRHNSRPNVLLIWYSRVTMRVCLPACLSVCSLPAPIRRRNAVVKAIPAMCEQCFFQLYTMLDN